MDMARYLVEAHLKEGRSVSELAAAHGVHRSWVYKLVARYRAGGEEALKARSRRPRSSPGKVSSVVEGEIVALRGELINRGLDAGAHTIHWHLERNRNRSTPSVSSIWRVLKREGLVTPQPQKRPRSSFIRFEARLPNEMWQSDMTHYRLADGTDIEIVNFIDDHSRLCLASVALSVTKATDVVTVFRRAKTHYGTPVSVLTDNGCIYTARFRGGKAAFEIELGSLGVTHKHSSPYHPQTCGKVERFHQTLKRSLNKQKPAASISELQTQIDSFIAYYNQERPHRALDRKTPQQTFDQKIKAHPTNNKTTSYYRIRHDRVNQAGKITLRYNSQLHHIGIGRAYKHQPVTILTHDRDIRIINQQGELLRQLTLDPNRNYQPQTNT